MKRDTLIRKQSDKFHHVSESPGDVKAGGPLVRHTCMKGKRSPRAKLESQLTVPAIMKAAGRSDCWKNSPVRMNGIPPVRAQEQTFKQISPTTWPPSLGAGLPGSKGAVSARAAVTARGRVGALAALSPRDTNSSLTQFMED